MLNPKQVYEIRPWKQYLAIWLDEIECLFRSELLNYVDSFRVTIETAATIATRMRFYP